MIIKVEQWPLAMKRGHLTDNETDFEHEGMGVVEERFSEMVEKSF